jgi:hypothetical protein
VSASKMCPYSHFPIPAVREQLQRIEVFHVGDLVFDFFLQCHAVFHAEVVPLGQLLALLLQFGEQLFLGGLIDLYDHVLREVDHTFQTSWRHVEQQTDAAGDSLHEPTVGYRRRQVDMAHALTANLRQRHFDSASVATYALVAYLLVFSAVAFEVLGGAKDPLAEKPISLGFQTAVVNGLRFCYLTP